MDERLHRALSEFGLLHYADQLIESEIFDVATLESLTPEDWEEVIPNEEDRGRLQDVVKMMRLKERSKPRVKPSWRPAGNSFTSRKKKAASPSEEGVRLEKHRVHLRKQREIFRNPTATSAELEWANTSDPQYFGGDPSPPVSFTGSRWLLKIGDKVRLIKPVTKLWKCIGAVNTKQYPQAGLMSGKEGEIIEFLKDALSVKFENATLSMPADALELLSTKHVTLEEVDHIRNHKKKSASRTKRKSANATESGSPEVIGRQATRSPKVTGSPMTPPTRPATAGGRERPPWGANPNAWERSTSKQARRSTSWKKNPTRPPWATNGDATTDVEDDFTVHDVSDVKNVKRPHTPSFRRGHPIKAPVRANGNKDSLQEQHIRNLEQQLASTQSQLSEANQKVEVQSQAHAEVKDLLKGFSSIAQTLASSSTVWAEQLVESHPKSAALAEELRNANQSLAHRLSILSTELV